MPTFARAFRGFGQRKLIVSAKELPGITATAELAKARQWKFVLAKTRARASERWAGERRVNC